MGLLRRLLYEPLRRHLPETTVEHDPALDIFDKGCWELTSEDGQLAGHVSSTLGYFRAPLGRPFVKQDWIWLLVVWADGRREVPLEEYPPFSMGFVGELLEGEFHWSRDRSYSARRLTDAERERIWAELGITEHDF
ncbi:MAG: hypothetical protein Q7T71_15985 [Herbiconiux sp.]|nr:hypothetical protein [Herbiconiux sp.]